MSYQIDHTDKPNYGTITVEDQTVNVEKSVGFVGKNYTGYSKVIAENFLHILENFASATAPTNPVVGQLWYDSEADVIEENTELDPFDPAVVLSVLPAPPAPIVTVRGEPADTEKPDAVLNPPAPPAPAYC